MRAPLIITRVTVFNASGDRLGFGKAANGHVVEIRLGQTGEDIGPYLRRRGAELSPTVDIKVVRTDQPRRASGKYAGMHRVNLHVSPLALEAPDLVIEAAGARA